MDRIAVHDSPPKTRLSRARRLLARCVVVAAFFRLSTPPAIAEKRPLPIVKIGAVVADSGPHQAEGRQTREGYDFWRDWVNGHGGIRVGARRYQVRLVYLDDGSNPNVTAKMIERLLDTERITLLLGPYGSPETLAAAAVAERRGVPLVTGSAALEKIYDQGYRYTFGVMSPARKYLAGIVDFAAARKDKPERAAIVAADDGFSLEAQQGAIQLANDHGIHVLVQDRYPVGSDDFTGLVARMKQAGVDMVLDAGRLDDSIALQRALVAGGVRAKLYGYTVGPDTPEFVAALGDQAEDVMGAAQWSRAVKETGGPEFVRTAKGYEIAFKRRFHHAANYHNASASAAALALTIALKRARTTDPQNVRRALSGLNIPSFYGRIAFDRRGLNAKKPMLVLQIQNRRGVTVYPERTAEYAPHYPAGTRQAR